MNSHDFDGIKVIHRSPRFGEGKIVELTDRYITIQFDNEAEAGITHRFIFPDSFSITDFWLLATRGYGIILLSIVKASAVLVAAHIPFFLLSLALGYCVIPVNRKLQSATGATIVFTRKIA